MWEVRDWKEGLDKWFKITCYLGFGWVLVDLLPHLPVHIVDKIFEAILKKLGI